jgi:hypothetical protein
MKISSLQHRVYQPPTPTHARARTSLTTRALRPTVYQEKTALRLTVYQKNLFLTLYNMLLATSVVPIKNKKQRVCVDFWHGLGKWHGSLLIPPQYTHTHTRNTVHRPSMIMLTLHILISKWRLIILIKMSPVNYRK